MPATVDPLPPNMTRQEAAVLLAHGVCAAYAAYNNGKNSAPQLAGYNSFNQINVYEFDPNVFPWSMTAAGEKIASAAAAKAGPPVAREPAAYASGPGGLPAPCTGPPPIGKPKKGYQLFGFTATANDNTHNIFVLRGTVTMEEAYYDLAGWGTKTACMLPSQNWTQQQYGMVNSYLYALYANSDLDTVTPLAASCLNAIQATSAKAPNLPWLMGAHSLGGPMLSLAAFDAITSGALTTVPFVMTFGSLHVGDATFAKDYMTNLPASYRIANLCDFVPSMVSLEPVILADPYVHVGIEGTFVWQTWDDWGNHSHANIYMPMVKGKSNWDLIKWGPRHYPQ